jgi:hypothetical protein
MLVLLLGVIPTHPANLCDRHEHNQDDPNHEDPLPERHACSLDMTLETDEDTAIAQRARWAVTVSSRPFPGRL